MRALELKVPPVVVLLIAAIAMWYLRRVPAASFDLPGARIAAAALLAAGILVAVRGVIAFRWHGTTVNPHTPGKSSTIVRTDVYRLTRNPMYLGLALALVSFGLWLGSLASLAVVPLFVVYLTQFQIKPEERALEASFGRAYAEYRRAVRRWL